MTEALCRSSLSTSDSYDGVAGSVDIDQLHVGAGWMRHIKPNWFCSNHEHIDDDALPFDNTAFGQNAVKADKYFSSRLETNIRV